MRIVGMQNKGTCGFCEKQKLVLSLELPDGATTTLCFSDLRRYLNMHQYGETERQKSGTESVRSAPTGTK